VNRANTGVFFMESNPAADLPAVIEGGFFREQDIENHLSRRASADYAGLRCLNSVRVDARPCAA
jgi:hypothetical protein